MHCFCCVAAERDETLGCGCRQQWQLAVCPWIWMYRVAEINTGCKTLTQIKSFFRHRSDTWSVTGVPFRPLSRARRWSPVTSAVPKAVRHPLTDKSILSREPRLLFVLAPSAPFIPWLSDVLDQIDLISVELMPARVCPGFFLLYAFPLGRRNGWVSGLSKAKVALKQSSVGNSDLVVSMKM